MITTGKHQLLTKNKENWRSGAGETFGSMEFKIKDGSGGFRHDRGFTGRLLRGSSLRAKPLTVLSSLLGDVGKARAADWLDGPVAGDKCCGG